MSNPKPTPVSNENPPHLQVKLNFHEYLKGRAGRPYTEFESYVEGLCRFIAIEIEAGRMFWSYELPGDWTLKIWFRSYLAGRGLKPRKRYPEKECVSA